MSLNLFFNISKIVVLVLVGLGALLYLSKLIDYLFVFVPGIKHKKSSKENRFAIIIPARDESRVINGILSALKEQTYNKEKFSVYVITETESDPTNEITKSYGYNYVVRKHLELKGKGYAMNECISDLYAKNEKFDAFIIFDADNIPTSTFIEEMNNALCEGFDIALGYRNSKNWNDGWIASCTGLTFSKFNTIQNKARCYLKMSCMVSGTGYYVKESVLAPFKGWPFVTLTEDNEISTYATIHSLKTTYVENAVYYDEQPTDFKTSFNQRVRWVKGYEQVQKKYGKELRKSVFAEKTNIRSKLEFSLNVIPLILLIVGAILSVASCVVGIVWASIISSALLFSIIKNLVLTLAIIYFAFVFDAVLMLTAEGKKLNMKFKNKVTCCLMNPVYWFFYIPCALKAIFSKKVEWKRIEHKITHI